MSSSCIPSLLLQSLYVVGLGLESGLSACEVLDCPSSGLSGEGNLDIEGFVISQGKEVEGRDGVDWALVSCFGAGLLAELGGGDDRGGTGVGSGSSVHADLEVFGTGRGDWDSMLDFSVDVDRGRGASGSGHWMEVELMLTLLLDDFLLSVSGCVWWY